MHTLYSAAVSPASDIACLLYSFAFFVSSLLQLDRQQSGMPVAGIHNLPRLPFRNIIRHRHDLITIPAITLFLLIHNLRLNHIHITP